MGKTIALFSGGKDGVYALMIYGKDRVSSLVSLTAAHNGANQFHAGPEISKELRDEQLKLIGRPHEEVFIDFDEPYLNQVFQGLSPIAKRKRASGLLTGDLWHPYTNGVGDMLAGALGLEIIRPAKENCPNNESSRTYMERLIESGVESIVVSVRTRDLPMNFVGRKIDKSFLDDIAKYTNDFAGEGGQYQSFVTKSPIMKKAIIMSPSFAVGSVPGKNGKESFWKMFEGEFHSE